MLPYSNVPLPMPMPMPVLVPVPLSQREVFDRRVAEVGSLSGGPRFYCWITSAGPVFGLHRVCAFFYPSNGSKALQQCPIPRADQKFKTGDVVEFRFDATIQRTEVRACMCLCFESPVNRTCSVLCALVGTSLTRLLAVHPSTTSLAPRASSHLHLLLSPRTAVLLTAYPPRLFWS